ncbi:MAG TPA: TlpA disulfide reductase family protein [Bryobacteraceae bacterium]|nr:TlpA disulfide reductase family protein [Bryobacteraceae bacterium]
MRRLVLLCLFAVAVCAQKTPNSNDPSSSIEREIKTLRSLPDDARATTTRTLALQIRALPPAPGKVALAVSLSNLATEGDFGRGTLPEVATTLAQAIHERASPASAYAELARLVHYEHVDASLDDPKFGAALAELKDDDRARQNADFTLQDLHGKQWTLKQLRGNVVLVNFWATWCPPCRKEMPDLEKLSERFGKQGLIVLAMSDEETAKVAPFIRDAKYTYPILLDPGSKVHERFHVQGIPVSLVYDRDGKLVAQSADMRTMGQFLEMLNQAGLR